MNNRDWERFGEDIRRTIQDAVEFGNYDRLNQTITDTVNQATDWVSRSMGSFVEYDSPTYCQPEYYQQGGGQERTDLFKINMSTKVSSVLYVVFGALIGIPFSMLVLLTLIGGIALSDFSAGFWLLLIISTIFATVFLPMGIKGLKQLLSMHRFRLYKKEIGHSELCNISILASCVGKSSQYVVEDVEMMIRKGWLRQGHLDSTKTCLIVTDKMYHQYLQLEEQKESQSNNLSPEVQKVISQGDAYVQKIRECNDAIPGEEISQKIYRIEVVVDKIFDRVEQNPESVSDIRKLMDYYLPTTVKLLEAYAQMDAQPVDGTNIQTAKKEIEATLGTLNVAFEKLLDSLFQHAAWDVSSDISVLNTMLAQEGLKEDGLKNNMNGGQ